jgi:hypothetical protein
VSLDDAEADSFFIAPLPVSLKERSLLTPRLAAEIATNRFFLNGVRFFTLTFSL